MFKSKRRKLIYPQSEHQRLAGVIAQHWGNASFEKPNLPFNSFLTGVALHDNAFGYVDNFSIGDMSEEDRCLSLKLLIESRLSDKIAEAVVKHHVLRLVHIDNDYDSVSQCEAQIADLVTETGIPAADYQAANRITELCDSIAFDFCFETRVVNSVEVFANKVKQNTSVISYEVTETQTVFLDPWPLNVPAYQGYIFAYQVENYPDILQPVLVAYRLKPK